MTGRKEDHMIKSLDELVQKLERDFTTGEYAVLENWLNQLRDIRKIREQDEEINYSKLAEEEKEVYNRCIGFLWGLKAAHYISRDEDIALTGQLVIDDF